MAREASEEKLDVGRG